MRKEWLGLSSAVWPGELRIHLNYNQPRLLEKPKPIDHCSPPLAFPLSLSCNYYSCPTVVILARELSLRTTRFPNSIKKNEKRFLSLHAFFDHFPANILLILAISAHFLIQMSTHNRSVNKDVKGWLRATPGDHEEFGGNKCIWTNRNPADRNLLIW